MKLVVEHDEFKDAVVAYLANKGYTVTSDEVVFLDKDNDCEVDNLTVEVEMSSS